MTKKASTTSAGLLSATISVRDVASPYATNEETPGNNRDNLALDLGKRRHNNAVTSRPSRVNEAHTSHKTIARTTRVRTPFFSPSHLGCVGSPPWLR